MISSTISFCKTVTKVAKIKLKAPFHKGQLTIGNVTFKTPEFALVDIGFMKPGVLLNNDSWNFENLTIGTNIKVYIECVNEEEVIVSRRKLDEDETWNKIENLCENGTEVETKIIDFTRKGIKLDVFGMCGAIFWTKTLIESEVELRNRLFLTTQIKSVCKSRNMVILTPSREIENTIGRIVRPAVWTSIIDLCDKGIWTHVDACNGIIVLSGRPWCNALDLINRLPFGGIVLSNFVKLEKAPRPLRSGDYVDMIVNFVTEVDESLHWDRNISSINTWCVWEWIVSLTLADRDRWCEWKSFGDFAWNTRLSLAKFNKTNKLKSCNGVNRELLEVNARQNSIWNKERKELSRLLCGFEFKRFKAMRNIINLMYGTQLNLSDRAWFERIDGAWLCETKVATTFKANWRRTLSLIEREQIFKILRSKVKDYAWREELNWADEQNLIDETKRDTIKTWLEGRNAKLVVSHGKEQFEGERRQSEIKKVSLYLERLNHYGKISYYSASERNKDLPEDEEVYEQIENTETGATKLVDMDKELDAEWNREWYLDREQKYWNKQHVETDCSLIETSYENWNSIKLMRPVYATIVGMDVQATLLMAAITKMLLTYICDFSLTDGEVKMLQNDWKNNLAIKVIPIALNYSLDDVLVEIDANGYKYFRFVAENNGRPIIGVIVKIEPTDVIIELTTGVYGKLRFNVPSNVFEIEVGMEVDVMVTDFNPITNDINLELSEDETFRTILVEP